LEMGGVALLVNEIRADRKHARKLFEATLDVHGAAHAHLSGIVTTATGKVDPEPTIPQRVSILERAMKWPRVLQINEWQDRCPVELLDRRRASRVDCNEDCRLGPGRHSVALFRVR